MPDDSDSGIAGTCREVGGGGGGRWKDDCCCMYSISFLTIALDHQKVLQPEPHRQQHPSNRRAGCLCGRGGEGEEIGCPVDLVDLVS